jgi:RNA polymerase sigma-B factor
VRTLVEQHLWIADHLARKYAGPYVDGDDLRQEATLGLIRATRDFDPRLAKFSTYGWQWARSYVSAYLRRARRHGVVAVDP